MSDPKPMPPPIPPGPVAVPPGSDKPASFGPGSFVDLGGGDIRFLAPGVAKGPGDPFWKPKSSIDAMAPNQIELSLFLTPKEALRADWDARLPPRKPPPAEADIVSQPKPGLDTPAPAPDQCGVGDCGADWGMQDWAVQDWGVQAGHDVPTPPTDPWG